jgi:hypothetical protein
VLVPPDAGLREDARPGWEKGPYAFMRRVLATEAGHELYKQRKATVEPVFAQNKFNRGFRRFQRRGRSAVRSEWRLQAAVGIKSFLASRSDRRMSACCASALMPCR